MALASHFLLPLREKVSAKLTDEGFPRALRQARSALKGTTSHTKHTSAFVWFVWFVGNTC